MSVVRALLLSLLLLLLLSLLCDPGWTGFFGYK
jgi:hypothetical protein